MARLRDTAKKMKEKLSANKQTPVTVEAISNDIDFRSKISREEFEEMNADLFERAVAPVRRLFEDSGLDVRSVDACVIVGGGSLMPKIQVRRPAAFPSLAHGLLVGKLSSPRASTPAAPR